MLIFYDRVLVAWSGAMLISLSLAGVAGTSPHFVAEVTVDPAALPDPLPRGIPVSLFIETGQEPLLAWLVSPLVERLGGTEE